MTLYEFWVPVIALVYAGLAVVAFKTAGKRLDAQVEAERRAKHPAE